MLGAGAFHAAAQDDLGPTASSRLRFGTVGLTPTFNIDGVGYESNVFYDPVDPKADMVATLRPELGSVMKTGPGLFTTHSWLAYHYFQHYSTQRSFSGSTQLQFEMPFKWLKPYASEALASIHDRPSPEIDVRVRTNMATTTVGTAFNVGPRATLDVSARRTGTKYDEDQTYLGVDLSEELDQTTTELSGSFSYRVTPVTKAFVAVLDQRNVFPTGPDRDSRSLAVIGGLDFGRSGPISGRATAGYRAFRLADPHVPDFTGPVVSVDLAYVIRGSTKFIATVGRDVAYSFSPTEPYYLMTTASGTVSQQVSDRIALSAGYTRQLLDYRGVQSGVAGQPTTVATGLISQLTAGASVRVSPSTRFSLGVETAERPAGLLHAYHNLRITSGMSYGF
jgi:hypothetical protein